MPARDPLHPSGSTAVVEQLEPMPIGIPMRLRQRFEDVLRRRWLRSASVAKHLHDVKGMCRSSTREYRPADGDRSRWPGRSRRRGREGLLRRVHAAGRVRSRVGSWIPPDRLAGDADLPLSDARGRWLLAAPSWTATYF